jgi:hypothetical protein
VKDALGQITCYVSATDMCILAFQYFRWLTDEEVTNVMVVENGNRSIDQKCICTVEINCGKQLIELICITFVAKNVVDLCVWKTVAVCDINYFHLYRNGSRCGYSAEVTSCYWQ